MSLIRTIQGMLALYSGKKAHTPCVRSARRKNVASIRGKTALIGRAAFALHQSIPRSPGRGAGRCASRMRAQRRSRNPATAVTPSAARRVGGDATPGRVQDSEPGVTNPIMGVEGIPR